MHIYTLGHSDHPMAEFVALLQRYGITHLVDVRSQPYSRWTPQFNREDLAAALQKEEIVYLGMGDTLGGRPKDPDLYTPGQERPDYARMAETAPYQAGIARLMALAARQAVAVMCSEGDHRHCHRHLLITQTLLERGATVHHIQPDGTTVMGELLAQQLSLF